MGYEARDGDLVADESERATVDIIVSLKGEGKSLREIAVVLEGRGSADQARWALAAHHHRSHPAPRGRACVAHSRDGSGAWVS